MQSHAYAETRRHEDMTRLDFVELSGEGGADGFFAGGHLLDPR